MLSELKQLDIRFNESSYDFKKNKRKKEKELKCLLFPFSTV